MENVLNLLKNKNIETLNLTDLKNFIKNKDEDKYYKNVIKDIYKRLKAVKKIEKQIKHYKSTLESLQYANSTLREDLYSKLNRNNFVPGIEECFEFNILTKQIEKRTYSSYQENENCKYFKTEEEANNYKDFCDKLKNGVKFKIKNKGKWNDGIYNKNAKSFYNVEDRKQVYNFDDRDKIWTIVKTGYFENAMPMPLTEYYFKNDEGNEVIEWEIPRYMYGNIEFVE